MNTGPELNGSRCCTPVYITLEAAFPKCEYQYRVTIHDFTPSGYDALNSSRAFSNLSSTTSHSSERSFRPLRSTSKTLTLSSNIISNRSRKQENVSSAHPMSVFASASQPPMDVVLSSRRTRHQDLSRISNILARSVLFCGKTYFFIIMYRSALPRV
jgi:hypothetical protein